MERDVHRAELDLDARELRDQPPQPLCQWDAAGVDPDEGDVLEVGVPLDDLVRDADEGAPERFAVEQNLSRQLGSSQNRLLSGLTGPG